MLYKLTFTYLLTFFLEKETISARLTVAPMLRPWGLIYKK